MKQKYNNVNWSQCQETTTDIGVTTTCYFDSEIIFDDNRKIDISYGNAECIGIDRRI